jgi:REP element-mobilizing transposase RayT
MKSNRYNPKIHHRRSIRLKGYDYSQPGLYFITICCQDKRYRFGKIVCGEMILNDFGKIVNDEWQCLKIKYPNIALHDHVVMPNHFHSVFEITNNIVGAGSACPNIANTNENIVVGAGEPCPYGDHDGNTFYRTTTPVTVGNIIGYFKYQTTKKIDLHEKLWQRNYWETIIRNDEAYRRITNYIKNNPGKWWNDRFFVK